MEYISNRFIFTQRVNIKKIEFTVVHISNPYNFTSTIFVFKNTPSNTTVPYFLSSLSHKSCKTGLKTRGPSNDFLIKNVGEIGEFIMRFLFEFSLDSTYVYR